MVSDFDQSTLFQPQSPTGDRSGVGVVSHHQKRRTEFSIETLQEIENLT